MVSKCLAHLHKGSEITLAAGRFMQDGAPAHTSQTPQRRIFLTSGKKLIGLLLLPMQHLVLESVAERGLQRASQGRYEGLE